MTAPFPWMIYGANGYTGKLIAERAVREGLTPILAGRDAEKIRPLAQKLGLQWRAFPLTADKIDTGLKGISLVLHCAGPFAKTSAPMVAGALRNRVHYLDITGEIGVFEKVLAQDKEAQQAGVSLIPGVGFDVVPTDNLAATLAKRLPGATHLEIAFDPNGKASQGTLKTAVEMLAKGGRIRKEGKLLFVPLAHEVKQVTFSHRTRTVAAIPWGDVSSAYFSTTIPNITCYMAQPKAVIRAMQASRRVSRLAGLGIVQKGLSKLIESTVSGPTEAERKNGKCYLWAKVSRGNQSVSAQLEVAEGYEFTVLAALASVRHLMENPDLKGALTPSQAFSESFVMTLPGSRWIDL